MLAVFLFCVFASLGVWQVARLQSKLALIDRVETRAFADPVELPDISVWDQINAADYEYTRVSVSGRFLDEFTQKSLAVTQLGGGFWVMTPFQTQQGFVVWVNRGFVDNNQSIPPAPQATLGLVGLLRMSEPQGGFLRTNQPELGRFYSRDVAQLTEVSRLSNSAPYFIDLVVGQPPLSGDQPVPGLTVLQFKNNHLSYALTWFALAAGVVGVTVWLLRAQKAGRSL